jgi:hypothetical protein
MSELDQIAEQYLKEQVQKGSQFKWKPIPDKDGRPSPQRLAYESTADVIGYGGAAGGGKSDLLLGLALTKHTKSVIFRREAKQLRELVDRSHEIINENGRFNENLLIWRGLPGKRTLEFGGVKDEVDVNKWRGRSHDLLAFDEVCEFTRKQFIYLSAWARTTIKTQRVQIVAAFNPPNSSDGEWILDYWGAWVNDRHAHPANPGEIRWYAMIEGKDTEREDGTPFDFKGNRIIPKSRTFIPAKLSDNPYLSETGYGATLQGLDEDDRRQLLDGDFTSLIRDHERQVLPKAWVDAAVLRGKQSKRPELELMTIGVDVSRGGDDSTCFAKRYGNWIDPLIKFPGKTITDGQALVTRLVPHVDPGAMINIDAIGVGTSAYDQLSDMNYSVIGTIWSEAAHGRDKTGRLGFVNTRARDWWTLREMLDPKSEDAVCLPDDQELIADLIAPRYEIKRGNVLIESKEDIKKRRGKSTDCGDAVVLAFSQAAALPGFRTLG